MPYEKFDPLRESDDETWEEKQARLRWQEEEYRRRREQEERARVPERPYRSPRDDDKFDPLREDW